MAIAIPEGSWCVRSCGESLEIDKLPNNGEKVDMLTLSKELTKALGKGFSRSNLFNMKKFYLTYPSVQTLSGLSWSHYCELLSLEDDDARSFYEKECVNSNWSVRELKRQIDTKIDELFQNRLTNYHYGDIISVILDGGIKKWIKLLLYITAQRSS